MAFTKITNADLNSRGATTLADQPNMSAALLKQEFDAPAKEVVAPKFNNLIDELEATTAAASLGATAPTGRSGETVQAVLDDLSGDLATVESEIATAIQDAHTHDNKALLDSYNQSNADIADAVSKKHSHANKTVLDKFGESGGQPTYNGNQIGTVHNAYKNVKVGDDTITASGEDTLTLEAGAHIRLVADTSTKKVTISMEAELVQISVTHAPTKTVYGVGETLDLTGIVVTATYSDALTSTVTESCLFSPANGTVLTTSDTSITISYTEAGITKTTTQAITVRELSSIAVTTPPTKTEYVVGEELDLTGIVVTASYADLSTEIVTSACSFSPANGATLSISDTAVTVTYTEGSVTETASQAITVSYPIYGAEWDGTSTSAWTRTDNAADFTDPVPQMSDGNGGWTVGSSPFDTIQPWAGMVRVTDADAGELVAIPKFYYKMEYADTINSKGLKIQISMNQSDGFLCSPAHMDRGDGQGERDIVYVGRYHCTGANRKSISGALPSNNEYRSTFRTSIHNLGTDIWQWDYATLITIWLLYLVEFANWNSQACIGYGCSNNNSSNETTGITDSMTYHTGTNQSSRTTYGHTQYRYIEDLWGAVFDWCDGIYVKSSKIYCIKNPSSFSDTDNGTVIGNRYSTMGYISAWAISSANGLEYALRPTATLGSETTYVCDEYNLNTSGVVLAVGGDRSQYQNRGLFRLDFGQTATTKNAIYGSRLMKLPANS